MAKEKKVTPIESALTEYNTENLTMSAIKIFKDAEALECVDVESRKVIGKHRALIKTFRIQVEDRRKEINRKSQEKNNGNATLLVDILNLSFAVFDKKIKAYDAVADEKRLENARIKKEAEEKIEGFFSDLDTLAKDGLAYNRTSEQIAEALGKLETFELSAVDFGERFDEAERVKADGISTTQTAFNNRLAHEKEQEEQAKIKADNEAAAKKLADEQAKFKLDQAAAKKKSDAAQKKKDDTAKKLADKQTEDLRKANEKLEDDRKAMEKKEAEFKAKEEAAYLEKYLLMYDEATIMNWSVVNDSAKSMNKRFNIERAQDEEDQKAKLKADKARAKLVKADRKKIQVIVNQIDQEISKIKPFDYDTDEGGQVVVDLYIRLKESLSMAEDAGKGLV